jgi:hypothetical protein
VFRGRVPSSAIELADLADAQSSVTSAPVSADR